MFFMDVDVDVGGWMDGEKEKNARRRSKISIFIVIFGSGFDGKNQGPLV